MKDPIQVDWRQYPLGTPAVFRICNSLKQNLKLIYKFEYAVLFATDCEAIFKRFASGSVSDNENILDVNDILLPWSHAIAEGHNPDRWTNAQIGEGYRLVDINTEPFNPEAEVYFSDKWSKTRNAVCYSATKTYRLPIKPKLSAKDFPPGTVVRFAGQDEHSWQVVIRVTQHEFHLADSSILAFDKSLSMATSMYDVAMQRSLDGGKTWLSC